MIVDYMKRQKGDGLLIVFKGTPNKPEKPFIVVKGRTSIEKIIKAAEKKYGIIPDAQEKLL